MGRFALINDGAVSEIRDADSIDQISDGFRFQQVIDVSEYTYGPEVGWVFDGVILYKKCPDVTPRQIRQALILSGLTLSEIESAFDALPEPNRTLALVEWEYSNLFERRRHLVIAVGQMLGWTPQQLDGLWILAGSL